MKKISIFIIAFAMVVVLSQCKKKETPTVAPVDDGKMVHISVNAGQGDKYILYPNTGAYVFENGDKLYVGNNGKYVGTLTYSQGRFSGNIYEPSTDDYLHFYFTGNEVPSATPITAQGGATPTTSFTVSIADQSENLPVLSYAHSTQKYTTATATYSCILENKCGLVKFITSEKMTKPITVFGMKTTATIDFATPGITPTDETGAITLYPDGGSNKQVKWAILLPQEAVDDAMCKMFGFENVTCEVPAVTNNMYYTTGVNIALTAREFSVGANTKVAFSSGNLQAVFPQANTTPGKYYQAAPHQYDMIGNAVANTCIGNNQVTTAGAVDLFGWVGASSGSTMGNQGICNETDDSKYGTKAGEPLRSEWGPGMTIDGYTGYQSEGTNWRTLTKDEWGYLFNGRTNHSQKYGLGIVNGVKGMIVLPDDWTLPEGLSFITGTSNWNNEYNIAQWEQMEWNGAVFLPAAGYRTGVECLLSNADGNYWSSTSSPDNAGIAFSMTFRSNNFVTDQYWNRHYGCSVRLVRNVQ